MKKNEKKMVSEECKQDVKYRDTDVTLGSSINQRNDDVSAGMAILCNILKNGMCKQHQEMSTKFQVTSQVWKDPGDGRGYGYVSKKLT